MKKTTLKHERKINEKFFNDLKKIFKKHPNKNYHIKINSDISRFETWIHDINDIKPILNSKVLSSGCGTAGDLFYFLKYSPKKAIGIETNSDYVKLARSRLSIFPKHKWGIDLYDGGKLPYKDNSFDIIFSMHVLEHVENPTQYIMELFRVLNRGGICFIELPNRYYPIEQHTSKPLVHWPSMKTRIKIQQISKKLRMNSISDSFHKLTDMNILWPHQVYKIVNNMKNVKIVQSCFHSYDGKFTSNQFTGKVIQLNKTTYRIVFSKSKSS